MTINILHNPFLFWPPAQLCQVQVSQHSCTPGEGAPLLFGLHLYNAHIKLVKVLSGCENRSTTMGDFNIAKMPELYCKVQSAQWACNIGYFLMLIPSDGNQGIASTSNMSASAHCGNAQGEWIHLPFDSILLFLAPCGLNCIACVVFISASWSLGYFMGTLSVLVGTTTNL